MQFASIVGVNPPIAQPNPGGVPIGNSNTTVVIDIDDRQHINPNRNANKDERLVQDTYRAN